MDFKQIIKDLTRGFWSSELSRLDDLRSQKEMYEHTIIYNKELQDELNELTNILSEATKEISKSKSEISNYKRLFIESGRPVISDWKVHSPNYRTTDGLSVPPNTFITINDRKLRAKLISLGFHKLSFEELYLKLEQWCYEYVKYQYDNNLWGNMEQWTSASHVFQKRISDCEDHAILFQTCMHMLGYGDRSVVMTNVCRFGESFEGGHAYNKVLINGKWIVVDPTNPTKYRKADWVYDIKHPQFNWFFNYWGTYKISNEGVLE